MADSRHKIDTLDDLRSDPQNPNRGTTRGREFVAHSAEQYGFARSIVCDQYGTIISGNKTFEVARAQGARPRVVDSTGEDLIVVRRTDLDLATDTAARQLSYADNRAAELGLSWDPTIMEQHASAGLDLAAFWTPRELEQLHVGTNGRGGQTSDDAVVPIHDTTIQPGDLFECGPHRVVCGDATDAEFVERVLAGDRPGMLVTDPPFGDSYDPTWRVRAGGSGRHAVGRVANDDRVDWRDAFGLFPGDVAYVFYAALHAAEVAEALKSCNFELRAEIVWVKTQFVLGRGDYHWKHEPAWYAVRKGASSNWSGDRTQSTVWTIPNLNPFSGGHDADNPVTGHSTQKPVALYERALINNSAPGDLVMDMFAGSGTMVIAAEKTGRRSIAIELDPRYVQVMLDRWAAYTHGTVRKVSASAAEASR
jgi:hypothetical protein